MVLILLSDHCKIGVDCSNCSNSYSLQYFILPFWLERRRSSHHRGSLLSFAVYLLLRVDCSLLFRVAVDSGHFALVP